MRVVSAAEARLWCVAVLCFAAFAILGAYVSARTPTRIDLEATVLRGNLTPFALFFTALGRWWLLLPLAGGAFAVALAVRVDPRPIVALLLSQTVSQGAIGVAKSMFGRARPDDWLVYRENGLSYPSGHAATAIVFYLALGMLALRAPALPRGIALATAAGAVVCAVGIPWSRLALGAHYATDVAGGLLFGAGWLCASVALLYRFGALA